MDIHEIEVLTGFDTPAKSSQRSCRVFLKDAATSHGASHPPEIMVHTRRFALVLSVFFAVFPLSAGERTIPVDIFLMIDKSLSMAEPGKYESLHQWVREQLLGQILINGDWITVYQFYGKTDHLLSMTVSSAQDREKIVSTIDAISPNGQYTDIGAALDTIKEALGARGTNGRHKIMLLLTDLKQEAPWTSRYAGTVESYKSPYLAEARMIQHDDWFEITLDMDIQDTVVKTSRELFASIQETETEKAQRELPSSTAAVLGEETAGDTNRSGGEKAGAMTTSPSNSAKGGKTPGIAATLLPFLPFVMIVSVIGIAFAAVLPHALGSRRKKDENRKP